MIPQYYYINTLQQWNGVQPLYLDSNGRFNRSSSLIGRLFQGARFNLFLEQIESESTAVVLKSGADQQVEATDLDAVAEKVRRLAAQFNMGNSATLGRTMRHFAAASSQLKSTKLRREIELQSTFSQTFTDYSILLEHRAQQRALGQTWSVLFAREAPSSFSYRVSLNYASENRTVTLPLTVEDDKLTLKWNESTSFTYEGCEQLIEDLHLLIPEKAELQRLRKALKELAKLEKALETLAAEAPEEEECLFRIPEEFYDEVIHMELFREPVLDTTVPRAQHRYERADLEGFVQRDECAPLSQLKCDRRSIRLDVALMRRMADYYDSLPDYIKMQSPSY